MLFLIIYAWCRSGCSNNSQNKTKRCNPFLHASPCAQRIHTIIHILNDCALACLCGYLSIHTMHDAWPAFRYILTLSAGLCGILTILDITSAYHAATAPRASLFVGPFRVYSVEDVSQGLHINELRLDGDVLTKTDSHLGASISNVPAYSYLP